MAGISSKAAGGLQNKYKFNSGCELEDELGLESYSTFFRKYDAQVGRFNGIDILAESSLSLTPFQFGADNPVLYNDPRGDLFGLPKSFMDDRGNKWHAPSPLQGTGFGYYEHDRMANNLTSDDFSGGGGEKFSLKQAGSGRITKIGKHNDSYGFWTSYTQQGAAADGSTLEEVYVGNKWNSGFSFGDVFNDIYQWGKSTSSNIASGFVYVGTSISSSVYIEIKQWITEGPHAGPPHYKSLYDSWAAKAWKLDNWSLKTAIDYNNGGLTDGASNELASSTVNVAFFFVQLVPGWNITKSSWVNNSLTNTPIKEAVKYPLRNILGQ